MEAKEYMFEIHQKRDISKPEKLADEYSYADFRSLRAKLLWISNSRPDATYAVTLLTQVTEDRTQNDKNGIIKKFDNVVTHLLVNI